MSYDPRTAQYLSFVNARKAFVSGQDTPRAFLERCIDQITNLEPTVRAFSCLDLPSAKKAADASTVRWREGRTLSAIDGLPVGVKDCFDVRGFPTKVNSALFGDTVADLDAAHVQALRSCGAIIVGKTVTTELTMAEPGPTWNPWDLSRTPGGSSSGSAAAVAARMLPIATASQARGSAIRPASICGIIGLKPTFGALNHHGGFDPSPSLNHLALLGGTLADVWEVAYHIATVIGGDPGYAPLVGGLTLPQPRQPLRVARQYTYGWPKTDEASKHVFEAFLSALEAAGVKILEPDSKDELREYEDATTRTPEFLFDLMLWEIRWPMLAWQNRSPGSFSDTMSTHIKKAEQLTPDDYRRALKERERLRHRHRALKDKVDCFVTLAHIGPGQLGQPKLGTPWYNDASSAIGAPAFNLPILVTESLPLGVQIMGFEGGDEDLAAIARWCLELFRSRTIC